MAKQKPKILTFPQERRDYESCKNTLTFYNLAVRSKGPHDISVHYAKWDKKKCELKVSAY